jgi:teichuronic acid biosynthesis glycosyltransferase TuaC
VRILVLSSVFPNPQQPTFGTFVRERAVRIAARCETVVVAPVPWFPMNRVFRGPTRCNIPSREMQGDLIVHHPKAFSVPGIFKALDGLFYFLSVVWTVARIRRQFRFDLIDAHFAYPDGLAACLLGRVFGCPVTVTLRGTIVPLSRYRLRRVQIARTLASVGQIFAVSESLKAAAVALGIPAGRIRVVPNGVDTGVFAPRPRAEARGQLGLGDEGPILLTVGALSPRKGHQRVIEVLPKLVAAHPKLLYVVVGGSGVEGDTRPVLERLVAGRGLHDHVRFVGPLPHAEIARWLAAADLFCLATSNEGRANVILEALACGIPVVTTDVGGSREVIVEGADGLLVPFGDPEALGDALRRGLTESWDHAGIASRARSRTWDDTVEDVLRSFRALLPAASRDPRPPVSHSSVERPWS